MFVRLLYLSVLSVCYVVSRAVILFLPAVAYTILYADIGNLSLPWAVPF